jgi:NADPH:quinone reductase-like Zn-dependent oxidoreductase
MGEHSWGAHGESVIVGSANLVRKPAATTWEVAAAYGLCGLTAFRMLQRARLEAGETVLVVGAGGGVATAAIALAVRMGATVITTSREAAKRERALSLGASQALATPAPGGAALGVKADVVVDSAGAPTWAVSVGALNPGGRLVTCGGTGGGKVELSLPRLFFGQHELIGSSMGTFEDFARLTEMVSSGLPVAVDSTYPLSEYPEALGRLSSGAQFGKVVLRHQ